VGAIGRGRALVVVGDSRQLPPTSFFQRFDDSDEPLDDDAIDDLESVLDECGAAGLPRLHLRWHYRSRHESLIAFSNHHYYDNQLLTFPAPAPPGSGLGVRLVPVAGVYDRGRSQTNRVEAEALVAEVLRRLSDPQTNTQSIGIVTFSQPQQVLVEDLLDAAVQQRPELERFFAAGVAEPVFVKNLENVQGDERDVVLFSICYGPDAAGVTWLHFGPINQHGGERRLNVAITRARRELLVFSSLRAEQIDLARTGSLGVRHLRAFLDYADRGLRAITEAVAFDPAADVESPFEGAVRAALQQHGFEVHAQVGCSGYRIDLGVVDPRLPGRYLAGVECDGATYHMAATARDRDRLRAAVLQGLGWQLLRVWSTDYWLDPAGEVARLLQRLRELQQAAPLPAVVIPAAPPAPVPSPIPAIPTPIPTVVAPAVAPLAADPDGPRPYAAVDVGVVGKADDLGARATVAPLRALVQRLLDDEAPVAFDLLMRRVGTAYGLPRITERSREHVRAALAAIADRCDEGDVLWAPGQDPAAFRGFRIPVDAAGERAAEQLPPAEVANAMLWLLRQHGSLAPEDLQREAMRQFGIQRLGNTVRAAAAAAQDLLLRRGDAQLDGERLSPVTSPRAK
jgi:very-short-patch-repair endonuclease